VYDSSLRELATVTSGSATTPFVNCGTTSASGTSRLTLVKAGTYPGLRTNDSARFEYVNCTSAGARLNGYFKLTLLPRPAFTGPVLPGYSYIVDSAFTVTVGTETYTFAGDFTSSTFYPNSLVTIPDDISIRALLSSTWRLSRTGGSFVSITQAAGGTASGWVQANSSAGFVANGRYTIAASTTASTLSYDATTTVAFSASAPTTSGKIIPTKGQGEFQFTGVAPRVAVTASGAQCTLRYNSRSNVTTLDSVTSPTCASLIN
jgi:hypothetical protein